MTIHLPRTNAGPGAAETQERRTLELPRDGGIVLVVEDDADVRAVTRAMFDDLRYAVVEAETAQAALEILTSGAVVDIMFSDVIMPGMNGVQLARHVRLQRPHLPILLTSGYTGQQTNQAEIDGSWPLLRKPYTQAALSIAIRDAMHFRPAH